MESRNLTHTKLLSLLGSLLFPVLAFICALWKPKSNNFRLFTVIFFTFIGVSFCYTLDSSSDISSYASGFLETVNFKGSFFDYFKTLHVSNQIDFISPFLTWFLSRFITSDRVYLGILAFITGVFLANNVWFVIKKTKLTPYTHLLLVLLVLIPQISLITHRWWMALQVFLFGLLPFVIDKNPKRLIFCLISIWIHFSFLYPLILTVIYIILPKKTYLPYLIIFVVLSVMDSFDFSFLLEFSKKYLPEAFNTRNEGYINFELQYHNLWSQSVKIIYTYLNIFISIIIYTLFKTKTNIDKSLTNLFVICLIIGSFAALSAKTEWGWRYYDISNFLFFTLYVLLLSDESCSKKIKPYFKFLSPFICFIIFFQIRGILSTIGPLSLFMGNFVTCWFFNETISVLNMIKSII